MSGLFLNFYRTIIDTKTVSIDSLEYKPYASKADFIQLKESLPQYHLYRNNDKILLWNNSNIQNSINNSTTTIVDLEDNPRILSKIFENGLIDYLKVKLPKYTFRKKRYTNTWAITSPINIIKDKISGLSINRIIHFSPYFISRGGTIFIGFTLSTSLKNTFLWTKADFIKKGIDIKGLKGDDNRIYPNKQAISRFLETMGVTDIYENKIQIENENKVKFKVINNFYFWLQKEKSNINLPFNLTISSIMKQYLPMENDTIKSEIIYKPKRYFYSNRTDTKRLRYYDKMVEAYQPYSLELYQNKQINIGVICPSEYQGETESFLKKIELKLKAVFHFKHLNFTLEFIKDTSLNSYKEVLYNENLLLCNLIYVIVNKSQEQLPPNSSPYHVCKAKNISNGIPTQDIQIETIRYNLNAPTMSHLALNSYAKLGGTAWTIEKEEKLKDELVIGIGSTLSEDGNYVLGIAQVFHNDGRYMTGNCSPLSSLKDYAQNLEEHLYKTLKTLIDEMSKSGTFRLIFHLFKSASAKYEIKAINNLKERLVNYNFEFALVHLAYGHNFRLYYNDGRNDIVQGTYIQLSSHSAILHFVKNSDLPLKIDLDSRSNFKSLFYIAKQVYWFSHLSHRSYMPAKRTVTIMYPSLMAKMTESLKKVEGWDYDRLTAVSDKLWFI